MNTKQCIAYKCTAETFRPFTLKYQVRWLDGDNDIHLAHELWKMSIPDIESFRMMWNDWRDQGYQFCAIVEEGKIIARAAIWRYSDAAWELAAVLVREEQYYMQGYGKSICSFVTKAILDVGRIATCHTDIRNIAMQRTAESMGYIRTD
ncbi:MAG: GNAT family N-acetyltransferase [Armatimonadota bacterium]